MSARFRIVSLEGGAAHGVGVRLTPEEIGLLERLPVLLDSVGRDPADPAAGRIGLHPVHPDRERSEEYARLVEPELTEARAFDQEAFLRTLRRLADRVRSGTPAVLTLEEADVWARIIGQARLAVAARLGAFDEDAPVDVLDAAAIHGSALSRRPEVALLHYLGFLQEELVEVLLPTVPVTG